MQWHSLLPLWIGLALLAPAFETAQAQPAGDNDEAVRLDFFEKKVRPTLVNHCYTCHSADTKPAGGLRVDDRNGLLSGGNSGPAIVPGDTTKSLLLGRVTHKDPKLRMPREGKQLSAGQLADLSNWIKNGAAWPTVRASASLGKPKPHYEKLKKEHWAWQPLTNPKTAAAKDCEWATDSIDQFILAKLESVGLEPVAEADKATLLRRVTFDLTGLPPTPAAIEAFQRDTSADAFAKTVDRLLASPQFGEQWGRHWLDLARYGESTGPSRNIPYPRAWKFRDYVIDSVNADVPFDRFIQEQIAGDLLPAQSGAERDRLLIATGFLALGVKDVNQRFKVRFLMDNVDEQIDVVTRSVLGLTVSCARCHDHKFDPIPTTDYYALAGIFTSTENCAGVLNKMGGGGFDYYEPKMLVRLNTGSSSLPAEQVAELEKALAQAKREWDAIRGTPEGLALGADGFPKQRPFRLKFERLQAELFAQTDPVVREQVVHGVRDSSVVGDTQVRIRGQAEKIGPAVPRGVLSLFTIPGVTKVNPRQSGRLELAAWLTSTKNPLTPRVAVNRIWQRLFGQGIVSTVDNFGVMGDRAVSPELLDHLATRFIADGWSVKRRVRAIVLTSAYRLGSIATEEHRSLDPANRLIWRHTPRRLTAEEMRDAILSAAGSLDLKRPTGSAAQELKMVEMSDNGPEARTINERADASTQRSVYLPLLRGVVPHALEAFDPVDQTLVTGTRDATTVPGQALYLLNSSFIRRQSLLLATRLLGEKNANDVDRIQKAYRLTLGRSASDKEVERAQAFLIQYESAYPVQVVSRLPIEPAQRKDAPASKNPGQPQLDRDQVAQADGEIAIRPGDARTAAWLGFVQALFGSAEFRYVR